MTNIPALSALPTPPNLSDYGTLKGRITNFLVALPTFSTELNALAATYNTLRSEMYAAAQAAANSGAMPSANPAYTGTMRGETLLINTSVNNGLDIGQFNGTIRTVGIMNFRSVAFPSLNTWCAIPTLTYESGIMTIRNATNGGSQTLHIDANAGVLSIANNLLGGVSYTLQFNPDGGNIWKIKQTAGALTTATISLFGGL